MQGELRALTLWRPWPTLIVHGYKLIENRQWAPGRALSVGDWFAIHAGKRMDSQCIPMAQRLGVPIGIFTKENMVDAAIVGLVRFNGCVTQSQDPWFCGPYGWRLSEPVRIAPIPCKGAQGLWSVDGKLLDMVRLAWRTARTEAA